MSILHMDPLPSLPLDKHGLPMRHWSGRTKAAHWLREWVNEHKPTYVTADEATDVADAMIREYLKEQR